METEGEHAPTAEHRRLREAGEGRVAWRMWGPYLSERQWGTVREDYSDSGDAWNYFTHDQARSRAYRWGEDGIAGVSDQHQQLCFALAMWNGRDPILKERLFGLTNREGNHGEDVKEYYYYLDSTPTHSYMRYLYKYPQNPYPYDDLVRTNASRGRQDLEYELIDTGVFDDDRYFDVVVEYAKAGADDLLVCVTAHNRGPDTAALHLLPTLWFRNTWWLDPAAPRPRLSALPRTTAPTDTASVMASHPRLASYELLCSGEPGLLFTENETNTERLFNTPNATPYVKDGINDFVVEGRESAVNPAQVGTKAAAQYTMEIPAGGAAEIRLRLRAAGGSTIAGDDSPPADPQEAPPDPLGEEFAQVLAERQAEADEFYRAITPAEIGDDEAQVMRQALAGMLWSKQHYSYNVHRWLKDHGLSPARARRPGVRNAEWFHMTNADIISMPDKWEYPWYAAWDLAFHTIALSIVDLDFAKRQLDLMLREDYLHPNGQIPAYEWNFSDVNPPVHAWAAHFLYQLEREATGRGDVEFLKFAFSKLLMNFTWWVNRKDRSGNNVFEGGFLGLDNIGVFDRSAPLPTGGHLEQADGTAWMAFFAQNMLSIAIELAMEDPVYEALAGKFYEHFLWIAGAMDRMGLNEDDMWDEDDGFFYDLLRMPDGSATRLKVRSMVGLLPLCASTVFPAQMVERLPGLLERATWFTQTYQELVFGISNPGEVGEGGRRLLSLLNEDKLRRVLSRVLDEKEFLSPFGIRSLSRHHLEHPYVLEVDGRRYEVGYLPAESDSGMFGGNSNWRGPVWVPMNALIVRALINMYSFYGDSFTIECPTGSGVQATLLDVAQEIMRRQVSIFTRGEDGSRPVFGSAEKFQRDPHFRDHLLFYEYFHGDNGAGIGASHQTGWTGLVARYIRMAATLTPEAVLAGQALRRLSYGLGEENEEAPEQGGNGG